MASKNLARTVIEGGRSRFSKWDRRASHRAQRTNAHRVSKSLCRGGDADKVVYPPRYLFARFDVRSTPGRHLVFDHLLPEVEGRWLSRRYFVVDRFGILRKARRT